MRFRTLLAALLAFSLLIPVGASAYTPRHGKPCRHGYTKRFKLVKRGSHRHRVRICARRHRRPATADKVKLHAHLDPSYTRNPLDPFQVTYAYSASATQEVVSRASASSVASASGTEEPASLPSGVLALYSDGQLECAINVGGSNTGSECPVQYEALGSHTVTTIYSSGEQSATETEVENIGPLATTTILSVAYIPLEAPVEVGTSSGLFHIGDLAIQMESSPGPMTPHLGCGEGSLESLTASGCYQIEDATEHVYARVVGSCSAPERGPIYISHATESSQINGEPLSAKALEAGEYHLRASVSAGEGYAVSEGLAALEFMPEFHPAPDC